MTRNECVKNFGSVKNGNNNQNKKESKKMNTVPKKLLKEYDQSRHFTSTAKVMAAMKEMFRDVIQTVIKVEMDEELGREALPAVRDVKCAQLPQRLHEEDGEDPTGRGRHQGAPGPERQL